MVVPRRDIIFTLLLIPGKLRRRGSVPFPLVFRLFFPPGTLSCHLLSKNICFICTKVLQAFCIIPSTSLYMEQRNRGRGQCVSPKHKTLKRAGDFLVPPRCPPPVYSARVKADSGKASPFPVVGLVLGGLSQSPHSLLCPWAPSTWLRTTPCLAELPRELSTRGVRAGMPAMGLWRLKVRGAGRNVLGWVALPSSIESTSKSRARPPVPRAGVRGEGGAGLSCRREQPAWVSGQDVDAPGRLPLAQSKNKTSKASENCPTRGQSAGRQ